ncbi:MAG: hypothetical protein LC708_00870, partial [Actinobacteria bacterium]|nr:hypothetical protein [Actinomycetota bacterium]
MTVVTDGLGVASAPLTANGTTGPYSVTVGAGTVSLAGGLSLTNVGAPATLVMTAGSPQSTTVNTTFASAFSATVADSSGRAVPGVNVTFTAPVTGPSGTFKPLGSNSSVTATTDGAGVVSASLKANTAAGTYNVTASAQGVAAPLTYALTNVAGAPTKVAVTGGDNQTAAVGTGFATPLTATVTDVFNNRVSGANVKFSAPTTGASGSFATTGTTTASALTNTSGVATAPTFSANGSTGSYLVTATWGSLTATFHLANQSGPPAAISMTGGEQVTPVGTTFPTPLAATVVDAFGNPVAGANVVFSAPATGASGAFVPTSTTTASAATNASGVATAPTLRANSSAGTYQVSATTGSLSPATVGLTNQAGPPASLSVTAGDNQTTAVDTAFPTALAATVVDAFGNPVAGANVTFSAPTTGPSGSFASTATNTTTETTGPGGVTTAAVLSANTSAGSYQVTAGTGSLSATFHLT